MSVGHEVHMGKLTTSSHAELNIDHDPPCDDDDDHRTGCFDEAHRSHQSNDLVLLGRTFNYDLRRVASTHSVDHEILMGSLLIAAKRTVFAMGV